MAEAQALTEEVIAWTAEHRLAPYSDGSCLVGPAPESRQWAMAMMAWSAPGEPEAPSWYYVTPPRPEWPEREREEWLQVFSRTTLPAITVHEVAPGHFSHGLALRHAPSLPRQVLMSEAFVEGWAHYVEEVAVEEGFHADDPRFAAGVAIEALLRVTRLACAIGLHSGRDDRRRGHPAGSSGTPSWPGRPRCPRRAAAPSTRRTGGTPGASWRSSTCASRPARPGAPASTCPASTPPCSALGSPPLGLLDHALRRRPAAGADGRPDAIGSGAMASDRRGPPAARRPEQRVGAADVRSVQFGKPPFGRRGYDEIEVDDFLRKVADALAPAPGVPGRVTRTRCTRSPSASRGSAAAATTRTRWTRSST